MTDKEKKTEAKIRPPKEKNSGSKPPVDDIDEALARGALRVGVRKKNEKKTLVKRGAIAAAILGLCFLVYYLFQPYKGTMAFGVCKVFIELNLQYPPTLQFNSVEEFSTSVRVWYTYTDSFGEYRLEPIQCYFRPDEVHPFALDKVTIRRREFNQDVVDSFNNSLSAIFAYPPDLTIPSPPSELLKNIQVTPKLRPLF